MSKPIAECYGSFSFATVITLMSRAVVQLAFLVYSLFKIYYDFAADVFHKHIIAMICF